MATQLRSSILAGGVLLLLGTVASLASTDLRRIEDVGGIRSYRMRSIARVGGDPPLQVIEAESEHLRDPESMRLVVRQGEGGREPVTFEIREVDGRLFHRMRESWGEIEKFNLAELILLTPEQLHGIEDRLEDRGGDILNGREALHLAGRKEDLPVIGAGHDTIDFSRMERADLDLWIDREEGFILKILIEAEAKERGEILPIHMLYEVYDFGADIRVAMPAEDEVVRNEGPVSKTQEDVNAKLGFEFKVPEGAFVSIYGATVNIITTMPLAEARTYAAKRMGAAGFTAVDEIARPTGEFYTDYENGGRRLGVQVFQVSATGATIQVGAKK